MPDFEKKGNLFMKQQMIWLQPPLILAVLMLFLTFLFYADNKYQTPPPYGASGVIVLEEADLEQDSPIFLIDGWLLSDRRVTDLPTYIGEFSNLARGDLSVPPHGQALYRLTLRYTGTPQIAAVDFPQLAARYEIFLDGVRLLGGTGNGRLTFLLTPGGHELAVRTVSEKGYYSGIYFPPALGKPETLARQAAARSFAYAAACLIPLSLAVFTFFMWRTGGSLNRWFAMLCCCYALYMSHYFVFLFALSAAEYWFLFQSLSLYGLCFCVVRLTALTAGDTRGTRLADARPSGAWLQGVRLAGAWPPGAWLQGVRLAGAWPPGAWLQGAGVSGTWLADAVVAALSVLLLVFALLIPVLPWAVFVHGVLTDFYYMFTFCCTAFFALRGIRSKSWEGRYTLTGCLVFGAGLAANLFFSNDFEPICFFWQFEWCGLLLTFLFGAMMVSRSRRILRENDALTNHLEEQVEQRTDEVTKLLNERKAFFSDMAHDLKAPVFATQSFISAIRKSSVGVDAELLGYLDQAEAKQREMARRLQGLSTNNTLDRIEGERIPISLRELLADVYEFYHGEAEVRSVHLIVDLPKGEAFLEAQPEKLDILFENLIYNALRATPRGGSITISAEIRKAAVRMCVADSGCGIPQDELPHIFKRFYVGAANRETGTGLGLYIVHSIVAELRGTIEVSSAVGKGTVFTIELPCKVNCSSTNYF